MDRFKKVFWFIAALVVVFVLWPFQDTFILDDNIHTRRFCAYGEAYVEFEHGSKVWGTTFLDDRGKPVKCDENDVQEQTSLHKEVI